MVAPRPTGRVGVDHRDDSLINVSGATDQDVSDSIIGRLRSEDADSGVAGASGGECVGDAFGDEQHPWGGAVVGRAGPGQAWVRSEAACGVVVLVGADRLEVAGLDVLDVAVGVERREGGGQRVAVGRPRWRDIIDRPGSAPTWLARRRSSSNPRAWSQSRTGAPVCPQRIFSQACT